MRSNRLLFSQIQTSPVVHDRPSTAPTTDVAAADRPVAPSLRLVCPRPARLHWLWSVDASAHTTYGTVPCYINRRRRCRCWWSHWYIPDWIMGIACWLSCRLTLIHVLDAPTSVGPCGDTTDLPSENQRPYNCCTDQFLLVASMDVKSSMQPRPQGQKCCLGLMTAGLGLGLVDVMTSAS